MGQTDLLFGQNPAIGFLNEFRQKLGRDGFDPGGQGWVLRRRAAKAEVGAQIGQVVAQEVDLFLGLGCFGEWLGGGGQGERLAGLLATLVPCEVQCLACQMVGIKGGRQAGFRGQADLPQVAPRTLKVGQVRHKKGRQEVVAVLCKRVQRRHRGL